MSGEHCCHNRSCKIEVEFKTPPPAHIKFQSSTKLYSVLRLHKQSFVSEL